MLELLTAAIHEIAVEPVKFVIELVQFAALVLIIRTLAKGVLGKSLEARRHRVEDQMQRIAGADARILEARGEASSMVAQANLDARSLVSDARASAKQETLAGEEALQAEVDGILGQARESLERERAETLTGIHDQLADVVVNATRLMLDQGLSPQEQREMVKRTILDSLDDLDRVTPA